MDVIVVFVVAAVAVATVAVALAASGMFHSASSNHDLRMANFDALPMMDAKMEKAIPFIQSAAVTILASSTNDDIGER